MDEKKAHDAGVEIPSDRRNFLKAGLALGTYGVGHGCCCRNHAQT